MKRRRLGDLFVVGTPVSIKDSQGSVDVWVQKLSPIEQETGLRRAAVERAKFLAVIREPDSELWQVVWADLHDMAPTKEQLLSVALREDIQKARARIEAELAAEDEWAKDDYLQGLVDAWHGTSNVANRTDEPAEDGEVTSLTDDGEKEPLRITHMRGESDPRHKEAVQVWDEISRFSNKVEADTEAEKERLFRDWDSAPIEAARDLAVEKLLEQQATNAMLVEFETQQLFYATREPDDHRKRYFLNRDEVAGLQPQVRDQLVDAFQALLVEPIEGKDLPGTPGSLLMSDSSGQAATPTSSGPEAATG